MLYSPGAKDEGNPAGDTDGCLSRGGRWDEYVEQDVGPRIHAQPLITVLMARYGMVLAIQEVCTRLRFGVIPTEAR